ncbi:MAG: HAMP domain-containing protein, partial [Treponema sp.]|nr:HAMP domain-containing protein [Treponema sp.]
MKTKKQKRKSGLMTVRFSIGAKLILLISFIVIVSLGSITGLVSWLVHEDLRVLAEENNFETNRRSAMEAEITIANVRSNARILIQTVTDMLNEPARRSFQRTTDFFFTENPQIASVFFITQGKPVQSLLNKQFFIAQEIAIELADSWFEEQRSALGRAVRGETLLLNAAPYFARPVLALFFPWQDGGAGAVLFSSENLNQNFGFGINQSYMINSDGDLLSHADFSLVRSATNISNEHFIRAILDSPQKNRQQLQMANRITSTGEDAIIRQFVAFTRLDTAGAIVITSIEYDKVFEGIAATTRRNIYLTIAVLSISIIFIWLFSKTISVPLKRLAVVARNIESGTFKMKLKPKSRDEIGVLTNSFQRMCAALHIFGRFTNREIAVKAMRGEIKPGGLPKHATIFFSDIREFTAKSEHFTKVYGKDASDRIV